MGACEAMAVWTLGSLEMLRISKLSDYAIVILSAMARSPHAIHTAQSIGERTHIALPTVSKLLKCLTSCGLLVSLRGRNGGYRLARDRREITVADVLSAVEGPVAMTECSAEAGACELEADCSVRPHWQHINGAVLQALSGVSLANLIEDPVPVVVHPRGQVTQHVSNGFVAQPTAAASDGR